MSAFSFNETVLPEFLNSGWVLSLDADRLLVGWGEWRESTEPNSQEDGSPMLYAPDFYLESKKPWRMTANWDVVDRALFAKHVLAGMRVKVNPNVAANREQFQWVEPEINKFETSFSEIRKGMNERGLKKGVPLVFAKANGELTPARIAGILKSISALPRQLYLYGFWSKNEGMIGATPEILFSKSEGTTLLETMALAGTRGKTGPDAGRILMSDNKERYEHQLVVDDLRERLGEVGDVTIGTADVLELPTLLHLRTRVRARPYQAMTFTETVELLHPTPALGVSPRKLGFEEMLKWDDPKERLRYGAPFGVAGAFGQLCLVAIRNIQWQDKNIRLGSGCGIVDTSVVEREWQELALKRESVKRMLSI